MPTRQGRPRNRDDSSAFSDSQVSAGEPETRLTNTRSQLDRFLILPFKGALRSLSPKPRHSSEGRNVTEPAAAIPPSELNSNSVAIPAAKAIATSQPVGAPGSSQKFFTKSKSFERDIALLHASFLLQKDPQFKEVILLIFAIRDRDTDDRLADVLEACSRFAVQLASAIGSHQAEATGAMTELRRVLENLKAQMDGDTVALDTMVSDEVERIKPSFLCNTRAGLSEDLSDFLDVTIGSTITVLGVLESASSLIPVPLVQPIVSQVLYMMKAVQKTRSNYDDMKEIAARAGEFAISCAVACSGKTVDRVEERRLSRFTMELEGIARECARLSQQGLFVRYLRQEGHANDLRAIEKRLNHAIALFQSETQLNIKLDMEVLKRNIDFALLDHLPSHPRYEPNEYLERSRDDVIEFISDWISNAKEPVLWIHGAAGVGKSTVAQQLIHLLQDEDRLAGAVLLTFAAKEHPAEVIRMIAKQLGEKHPRAVGDIAEATRAVNSAHDPLAKYLTSYIINPIHTLKYPYPLVIIMDALDEWSSRDSFLKELEHIPLPTPVKFILTSRFSYAIERALKDVVHHPHALPLVPQHVIEHYFNHHFDHPEINWKGRKPDEQKIRKLASLADGLIIWAATVRSLVLRPSRGRYPHEVLDNVTKSGEGIASARRLKQLYEEILKGLLGLEADSESVFLEEMVHRFLGAIVVLEGTLSVSDFARLSDIPESTVQLIHDGLAALQLKGNIEMEVSGSISPLFYHIRADDHHWALGTSCLNLLKKFLRSYHGQHCPASQLLDLDQYIVRFWPLHLSKGMDQTESLADTSLADLTSAEFYRWSTLFASLVLPGSSDEPLKFDSSTPLFKILYDLAMLIEDKGPRTLLDHLYCLEISGHLEPDIVETWITLGHAYHEVYKARMDPRNLDQEIIVFHKALEILSGIKSNPERDAASSDKHEVLTSLGNALQTRFEQSGIQKDLDEAICVYQEALQLCPSGHPNRSMSLNNLGTALTTRFEQSSMQDDLDTAIVMHQQALELCPSGHPDRALSLSNLAIALSIHFQQSGMQEDLDSAIFMHQEALKLRPSGHPDRLLSLNNLGDALTTRFGQSGMQEDLDAAILIHQEALELCPPGHSNRSMSLNNLGNALTIHFEQSGLQKDLDEAILMYQEALELRSSGHPNRPLLLGNLATALSYRFEQYGIQEDLDQAILMYQEAIALCPAPHPSRWKSLANLGNCLRTHFSAVTDVEKAIYLHREAISLCSTSHPSYSDLIKCLVQDLELHFRETNNEQSLDEAILLYRQLADLTTDKAEMQSWALEGLSKQLRQPFALHRNSHDLKEAEEIDQSGVMAQDSTAANTEAES